MNPQSRQSRVICLLLAVITFVAYGGVLRNGFIGFDDATYVTDNPALENGLTTSGIDWALTTNHAGNWHPLTWISHMLDVQMFGFNPLGHHLTNLLFHIANALLLFGVLRKMTGAIGRSAVVAALFALHPLHVESVAWVAERKDVLSTFFWLLTMLAYARYVDETGRKDGAAKGFLGLTLIMFALGLTSKPMLVTLPFLLLLLDYWPLKRSPDVGTKVKGSTGSSRSWQQLVLEKTPMFVLVVVSCVVTYIVQKGGGAVVPLTNFSLGDRAANALLAYGGYLRKMIWPSDLAIYYPLTEKWSVLHLAATVVVLAAISTLAILQARKRPYLLVGWLWFLGTLIPVLGLVQVGDQAMADRYTYMPLVGIFIMLVWGAAEIFDRKRVAAMVPRVGLAAGVLVVCAGLTVRQVGFWQNSETLFRHALDVTTNNVIAHINLGQALDRQGNANEAREQFMAAVGIAPQSAMALTGLGTHFARQGDVTNAIYYISAALRNQPAYGDAHFNLGNALASQGKFTEASQEFALAIRANPDAPDAHNNLGAMLVRLGRPDEAAREFMAALRLRGKYPEAHEQLADVLFKQGQVKEAEMHFAEALKINPGVPRTHFKLGLAQEQAGESDEAVKNFLETIRLQPTNAAAFFNLACLYAAEKELPQAADAFSEAIRLKPADAEAHGRLGAVLAEQGKLEEAIASYQEAIRLRPDNPETHGRLAAVLTVHGKSGEAIKEYREALRLRPDWPAALRDLAWILATNPKDEFRNGREALEYSQRACELTKNSDARFLSALDVAYAEVGRFDDAVKTAEQVQQLAAAAHQDAVAQQAAKRIELYHAGKPFRN